MCMSHDDISPGIEVQSHCGRWDLDHSYVCYRHLSNSGWMFMKHFDATLVLITIDEDENGLQTGK